MYQDDELRFCTSSLNQFELLILAERNRVQVLFRRNPQPRSVQKCFPSFTCHPRQPLPGVEIHECFLRAKCEATSGSCVVQPELSPCVTVCMWSKWTCARQVCGCGCGCVGVSFKFTSEKPLLHQFNSPSSVFKLICSFKASKFYRWTLTDTITSNSDSRVSFKMQVQSLCFQGKLLERYWSAGWVLIDSRHRKLQPPLFMSVFLSFCISNNHSLVFYVK